MYLETERLVLRQFTPDDVAALVALDADPAVMRFITNGVPTPPDEIADEHLPAFLAYYQRGDHGDLVADTERDRPEHALLRRTVCHFAESFGEALVIGHGAILLMGQPWGAGLRVTCALTGQNFGAQPGMQYSWQLPKRHLHS